MLNGLKYTSPLFIQFFIFDLQMNLHIMSLKNDLRIILGPKSKYFKNLEVQQKIRYCYIKKNK